MIPAAWRANLGFLLRHPWQLALSLIGIAIGVAVIVAVDLANSSARKAFLVSMDAVTGAATHQVIGGPAGVPEDLYARLRVRHGVRAIAPVVEGEIDVDGITLKLLGVDLFAERELRTFTGAGADESLLRRFLVVPGSLTLSVSTAERLGVETESTFPVSANGRQPNPWGIF